MNDDHRRQREALGAWVLGSLDGEERRAVEAHVAACDDCTQEVRALSAMPGLLGRLDEAEVVDGLLVPSPSLRDRLLGEVAATEDALRTALRRWRWATVGTAAAAVAALVVVVGTLSGAGGDGGAGDLDRLVAPVAIEAPAAAATTGQAAALAWEWGTTVEVELAALPARDAYVLWAVASDGRREQAGTWGPTESRGARVRGACSIQRDSLDRVEVSDADGAVLVSFDF